MAGTTRRELLKKTAKAALVASAGLTFGEILGGCAPALKETRLDIAQINGDCNPGGWGRL